MTAVLTCSHMKSLHSCYEPCASCGHSHCAHDDGVGQCVTTGVTTDASGEHFAECECRSYVDKMDSVT